MTGMKLIKVDYHRNGVGGVGFNVALIRQEGEEYLAIQFQETCEKCREEQSESEEECQHFTGHTAILEVTSLNAWLGHYKAIPGWSRLDAYRGDNFEQELKALLSENFENNQDDLYGRKEPANA